METVELDGVAHRALRRLLAAARVVPSVDDRTWTHLLLAYLDGRPKASHILGDYLEGEGLPRIRPGDIDQRLRYALGLLPPVLAHEVSCDLVDHVLPSKGHQNATVVRGLEVKRRWLRGEVSDAMLKEARAPVQALALRLDGAIAAAAAQAMASSPAPSVAQRTSRLAVFARRNVGLRQEVRWQIEHLRARLETR